MSQKILIVGTGEGELCALGEVLGATGAEVIRAETENEALAASLRNDFSLAVLDVQAQGRGPRLAERLRSEKRTQALPIIFLSQAYSEDYHEFRGFESGPVDFMVKPYHPKALLSKINVFLQLDRQRSELGEKTYAYMCRLEQSNRELQAFAAVASHDLHEPLRKIKAFGDLLISKHGGCLNEEAQDFVERMRSAADRMQILMETLLTYSRVATKLEPFAPVDLNKVMQEVLTDLEWRIKQTGATVQVRNLGIVEAEPHQMHQLFQNLIGNAIKFHGKPQPIVKVYAKRARSESKKTPEHGFCRIYVEDNGIGFDEKDLDRIFAPFQRLHGAHEYEGTGMGLAICNKIAQRHGGSIKAWSAPGHGATFVVTLPLKQTREEPDPKVLMDCQLSLYRDGENERGALNNEL